MMPSGVMTLPMMQMERRLLGVKRKSRNREAAVGHGSEAWLNSVDNDNTHWASKRRDYWSTIDDNHLSGRSGT